MNLKIAATYQIFCAVIIPALIFACEKQKSPPIVSKPTEINYAVSDDSIWLPNDTFSVQEVLDELLLKGSSPILKNPIEQKVAVLIQPNATYESVRTISSIFARNKIDAIRLAVKDSTYQLTISINKTNQKICSLLVRYRLALVYKDDGQFIATLSKYPQWIQNKKEIKILQKRAYWSQMNSLEEAYRFFSKLDSTFNHRDSAEVEKSIERAISSLFQNQLKEKERPDLARIAEPTRLATNSVMVFSAYRQASPQEFIPLLGFIQNRFGVSTLFIEME